MGRNKIGILFAWVAMVSAIQWTCLAAEPETTTELKTISGTVASIDTVKGEVTLKVPSTDPTTDQPGTQVFATDAGTMISEEGEPLSLEELQEGDEVAIQYSTKEGGSQYANSITLEGYMDTEDVQ